MSQKIKAEVTIEIPEEYAVIKKVELDEIKQQANPEWVSGLKWLNEQTGLSPLNY